MAHAFFPPSSAKTSMICSAAPMMNAKHGEYQIGLPGAVGTAIHNIVEVTLKDRLNGMTPESYFLGREESIDGHTFEIDEEMIETANIYVDYVRNRTEELNGKLLIEQRFTIDHISDECWGTADAVIIGDHRMEVIDLKSGKFPIDVEHNPQLMIYGLGALHRYTDMNKTIQLTIVQPRGWHKDGPIRSWDITAHNLASWGEETLKPAIEATLVESPKFVPGDHCKLCNAKTVCEKFSEYQKEQEND